jgi:hypothetical protein
LEVLFYLLRKYFNGVGVTVLNVVVDDTKAMRERDAANFEYFISNLRFSILSRLRGLVIWRPSDDRGG